MNEEEPQSTLDGTAPLRPGASIDEIQARVAHLSSGEATSSSPIPETPVGGPASTAEAEAASATADPSTETPAPSGFMSTADVAAMGVGTPGAAKPRRRGLRALGGAGAVIFGIILVAAKFGLKLFAVGVAAVALSGAFGDRYSKLPSNQRDAFEQRYQQIFGSSLDGLSDAVRTAQLDDLVSKGAGRLDDASLVLWTQIDTRAYAAADTATCATIARGWFSKSTDRVAVEAAVSKAYDGLSNDDYASIIDLDLKAMAAEKAGSPAVRSVSDATMAPVFQALDGAITSIDGSTIDALVGGQAVKDTEACTALRDMGAAAMKLPTDQFASWAVWTSTP
jgi:hypothetical protein